MPSLLRRVLRLAGLVFPTALGAQNAVLRIQVVDTARAAVAGVEVSIMAGLNDVRARGVTDDRGLATLTIPRGDEQRELIARKIGLARSSVFFRPSREIVSLAVTMHQSTRILDAVKVTEREDVKRRSYHADADEIAASKRPILDGMDVLTKLKPDILYGRMPGCGVQDIWVNGRLIRGVLSNPMVQARRGLAPDPRMKPASGRPMPVPKLQTGNEAVMTVMASIHPEHIEELNYLDCLDNSIDHTHGSAALYVVLKEGVGFELNGKGSYVIDAKSLPVVPAPADDSYRRRILGVYDELTGEPVSGVAVADSATQTTALSTVTGTVSLGFLPEGASTLLISKAGYRNLRLDVTISPRDTIPLTLLLTRTPR